MYFRAKKTTTSPYLTLEKMFTEIEVKTMALGLSLLLENS